MNILQTKYIYNIKLHKNTVTFYLSIKYLLSVWCGLGTIQVDADRTVFKISRLLLSLSLQSSWDHYSVKESKLQLVRIAVKAISMEMWLSIIWGLGEGRQGLSVAEGWHWNWDLRAIQGPSLWAMEVPGNRSSRSYTPELLRAASFEAPWRATWAVWVCSMPLGWHRGEQISR